MTEPQEHYESLESRYAEAAENVALSDVNSRVKNLTERVAELPEKIQTIRDRDYSYRADLEEKATDFKRRWAEISAKVMTTVQQEVTKLSAMVTSPKALLTNVERQLDNEKLFERLASQAEEAIETLENELKEAAARVEEFFEDFENELYDIETDLRRLDQVLDLRDDASFELAAGENVILASKAELVLTGKGRKDPDGVLFLTNQRLAFEQKERKGGVLGIGSRKEHGLEWEAALSTIDSIDTENKGMFGGKDMLQLTLSEGELTEVTLEVKGAADNKYWQEHINRVIAGEINEV